MTTDPPAVPDEQTQAREAPETPEGRPPDTGESPEPAGDESARRALRILIGSQRDRGAIETHERDWYVPGQEEPEPAALESSVPLASVPLASVPEAPVPGPVISEPPSGGATPAEPATAQAPSPESSAPEPVTPEPVTPEPVGPESRVLQAPSPEPSAAAPPELPANLGDARRFPPPDLRSRLPAELEAELEEALGGASAEELMAVDEALTREPLWEPDSRRSGRVVAVQGEYVFVDLGGPEQGSLPVASFAEPPAVGAVLEFVVARFTPEDGLYELTLPHAAVSVGDWSDLAEGMVVEARVTGHNTGGLECDVNHLRGFIPASQISLYHVEDLAQFVGEKFTCLVSEANPQRRNLVLSRRAVLEREREEARRQLLESLEPGQIREGVVRKLMDFGAFVDLGGVDGLLHVSQLAWGRVSHPRDVLSEGQSIKVKIEKIDHQTHRISLGYRDMLENPWHDAARKYPVNLVLKGRVTKLMEFGAFVELEPGVEGLVHVSELSHKRVWRTSDVVSEGDEVEVMVKSVDAEAQRIGLSMKDVLPPPETEKKAEPSDEELAAAMPKPGKRRPAKPLQGGLGGASGGDQFGLKW